jgi:hypothetical protein
MTPQLEENLDSAPTTTRTTVDSTFNIAGPSKPTRKTAGKRSTKVNHLQGNGKTKYTSFDTFVICILIDYVLYRKTLRMQKLRTLFQGSKVLETALG